MSNVALVVILETVPEKRAAFLEHLKGHAQRSLTNEEGCLQFDLMLPQDADNQVRIYEKYADAAAVEAHRNSDHMAMFQGIAKDYVTNRTIVICDVQDA